MYIIRYTCAHAHIYTHTHTCMYAHVNSYMYTRSVINAYMHIGTDT